MFTHCIYGSGLIGSYIGSVLLHNQQAVTLVARGSWQSRLREGMTLSDLQQHTLEPLPAEQVVDADYQPSRPVDVVWLTVKCTQVAASLEGLSRWVGADTQIICCQNGLGSDEAVKQAFPDNTVRRAMVPFNVVFEAPNRLHRGSEGQLTLERFTTQDSFCDELLRAVRHVMLPVTASEHIQAVLWAKLQLNLGNSVNALADIPVKEMLQNRGYRKVIAAAMAELLVVTRAMELTLPKVARVPGRYLPALLRTPDWLFKRLAAKMLSIDPKARASMWWDLQHGKPTEVQFLNGAVVEHARRLDIPCPANQALVAAVAIAEEQSQQGQGYQPWSAERLLDGIAVPAKTGTV